MILSAVLKPGRAMMRTSSLVRRAIDGRVDEPLRVRAREHLVAIDAATVVLHAHRHHLPLARDGERELSRARLAGALAHIGELDAVIGGVAQQMHDRLADLVEHRAIELDLAAVRA